MDKSLRVIFNVGIQYLRILLTVVIALYTSRVVIDALGADDYGIYSLIFGVVFMMSFVQSSLASTTQRFMSYHSGEENEQRRKSIFQNSLFIHIVSALFFVVLLLCAIPLLFNGFLNIPTESVDSAKMVYVIMLMMFLLMMISTPYHAVLISRENMLYISVVMLIIAILKVPLAISLYYVESDRLVIYTLLMLGVQFVDLVLLSVYCNKKYTETQGLSIRYIDRITIKELFGFIGWSVWGTFCTVGRTQGLAVVLNRWFGPVVNTSYTIAWQVSGQLYNLSSSVFNAVKPQISKMEGGGDRASMLRMSEITCKISYLLLLSIALPMMMEMDVLIALWLKEVPENVVMFCRFVVLVHVIDQLTLGLNYATEAVGKLRLYALVVNTTKLMIIPIAVVVLMMGYEIEMVMSGLVAVETLCTILRLPVLKRLADLSIWGFVKNVLLPDILPTVVAFAACYFWIESVDFRGRFIVSICLSVGLVFATTYFFSLKEDEKRIVKRLMNRLKKK